MAAKKIIIDYSATAQTVYAIVRREADGCLLDDADGTFGAAPADPYLTLTEDSIIKGRYEASEARTVWDDGRYTFAVYKQAGGSPAPASDTIIGTGEMWVKSDAEVAVDDYANFKADVSGLASQARLDFVEKWIVNKLVESPGGDAITLYDDDDTTPLKTWSYNGGTKTRGKAV